MRPKSKPKRNSQDEYYRKIPYSVNAHIKCTLNVTFQTKLHLVETRTIHVPCYYTFQMFSAFSCYILFQSHLSHIVFTCIRQLIYCADDSHNNGLVWEITFAIFIIPGTIGDWKNYLTVAENEAYDKWIESELKDSNITFTYE